MCRLKSTAACGLLDYPNGEYRSEGARRGSAVSRQSDGGTKCSAEAGSQDGYRSTVPYPRSEQFSATQRAEGRDDGGGGRGEGICAVMGEAMEWDDEWEMVGGRWEVGCRWTMDVPLRRCTESNESNALEVR